MHQFTHGGAPSAGALTFLAAGLIAAGLGSCGGDSSSGSSVVNGVIEQPVVMNLYPSQPAGSVPRLVVISTAVGSVAVSMPLVFDTGSAGVTLYAPSIFPASMVTGTGFIFPPGQSSITYNGITVTNQQGTRIYGTTNIRTENGNLGYAQLTFGDARGHLTTTLMPIFLYFSITDAATGQDIEVPSFQQGIFGVASTNGTITIAGSVEPPGGYPGCATGTEGTCYVVSALKYLQYGASVSAGFMLLPAPIQSCDITTPGSCPPAPVLTLGLTTALKQGFSTVSLPCPPSGYVGPPSIAGYPVCQKTVEDTTLTISGSTTGSIVGGVVFDTGTANMQIATPAGSSFPSSVPVGSSVLIATSSGFTYSYVSTSGDPLATIVNTDFSGPSIIGIGYFTTNQFFIDLRSGTEGWK
jgi:hypothetical protein